MGIRLSASRCKESILRDVLCQTLWVAMTLACASAEWEGARHEDTAAAYARFLRAHPRSPHLREAAERLDFQRLRQAPSWEEVSAFRAHYPGSDLLAELVSVLEESEFARARREGTVEAYEGFLELFPAGGQASRARGNLEFLRAEGFGGRAAALAEFAVRNPASDYADSARRVVAVLAARPATRFERLELHVEIDPTTPSRERLLRMFTQRAAQAYAESGPLLVSGGSDADSDGSLAQLRIRHREEPGEILAARDGHSKKAVRATTEVVLTRSGGSRVLWRRFFTLHTEISPGRASGSVLLSPAAAAYWASFFVPMVSWSTDHAVQTRFELSRPVAATDLSATRAVFLFADGDFRVIDPIGAKPDEVLFEYRRPRDLSRFDGVRLFGKSVVLFGEDGLEVVSLDARGARRAHVLERGLVGSVSAVEHVGSKLLIAGSRGLAWLSTSSAAVEPVLGYPLRGLARAGDAFLISDGASVLTASLASLRDRRLLGELHLGRGFAPSRLRADGRRAIAIGEHGVACLDLSDPARLRVMSRLGRSVVGTVSDAVIVEGQALLVGDRGLQLLDPACERVTDSVDVSDAERLAAAGRHVLSAGGRSLALIDAGALLGDSLASPRAVPAAQAPHSGRRKTER